MHRFCAGSCGRERERCASAADTKIILRKFLGKVDIAHDAGEARDEPCPFNAKSSFDRPVRLAYSHAALSAKAIRQASGPRSTVSFTAELLARPPVTDFP